MLQQISTKPSLFKNIHFSQTAEVNSRVSWINWLFNGAKKERERKKKHNKCFAICANLVQSCENLENIYCTSYLFLPYMLVYPWRRIQFLPMPACLSVWVRRKRRIDSQQTWWEHCWNTMIFFVQKGKKKKDKKQNKKKLINDYFLGLTHCRYCRDFAYNSCVWLIEKSPLPKCMKSTVT